MRLAFNTLGCPDWTLRQVVENAARMGYDGVDFRGLLEDVDITRRPEFTTHLAETRRLLSDHGVAVSGLSASTRCAVVDPAEWREHLDEARRNLPLAAELGAHVLRVFGGAIPQSYAMDSILPYAVEHLRQLGDEADAFDVTLAVETHDAWTKSAAAARLMAEADHPRVRVLWDLHHPYRMYGEAPEVTHANLAPYVVSTHIKDSLPGGHHGYPKEDWEEGHTYVLVGQGGVPLRSMLGLLVRDGYDDYAILEWEKRWHPDLNGPEVVFPQYVRQMRQWLAVPE